MVENRNFGEVYRDMCGLSPCRVREQSLGPTSQTFAQKISCALQFCSYSSVTGLVGSAVVDPFVLIQVCLNAWLYSYLYVHIVYLFMGR